MKRDKKGNCITENYEILINPKFNPLKESAEFGQIYDVKKEKVVLIAQYDPNLYRKIGYHFCAEGGVKGCGLVLMDTLYLKYFMDYPMSFSFVMLHELGHFINGDMENNSNSDSDIKKTRIDLASRGEVDPMELKADMFAAEEVGPHTAIKSLEYLREQRRNSNRLGNELAVKEFDNRIKAIKKHFNNKRKNSINS